MAAGGRAPVGGAGWQPVPTPPLTVPAGVAGLGVVTGRVHHRLGQQLARPGATTVRAVTTDTIDPTNPDPSRS
ncbi:MAG: hypothetical protein ACT4NP_08515 [Pseudonocardiales bacterium]